MAIDTELHYGSLAKGSANELFLDPKNPRLGADKIAKNLDPDAILNEMRDWELEELAVSFLENGFWPQEALLAVREKLHGETHLVVVEGNRRLAALIYLQLTVEGKPPTPKWKELIGDKKVKAALFEKIPYLLAETREEVNGYLGFRHVSGIKEWDPPQKAAFIGKMIDEQGLSYEQVMRRIGSKTEPVRRNYISYRVLMQMKEHDDEIDVRKVEQRFSVLFLSLRTRGVQTYLGIDIEASPAKAKRPVSRDKIDALIRFARWLFGGEKDGERIEPVVTDSRQMDRFDKVLACEASREYMERTERPDLEVAYRTAGGEEWEAYEELESAATHLRGVLSVIHLHRRSRRIQEAVEKVARASLELLRGFPELRATLLDEEDQLNRPVRSRK